MHGIRPQRRQSDACIESLKGEHLLEQEAHPRSGSTRNGSCTCEEAAQRVRRDLSQPLGLSLNVRALPALSLAEHTAVFDDDPDAVNSAAEPERVMAQRLDEAKLQDGALEIALPAMSWNMIRLLPSS